jgi:hypothetical protein
VADFVDGSISVSEVKLNEESDIEESEEVTVDEEIAEEVTDEQITE